MSDEIIMEDVPMVIGSQFFPWWLVLLQGIVALILGIMFLTWPYVTLLVAVTFIGAYWFVSGIFALIGLAVDRSHAAVKIGLGILGIIAGILILMYPMYSTVLIPSILIIFIGVWGIIMGCMSLFAAFKGGGLGAGVLGVLGIIFGFILLANPFIAVAFLPFVLGIFGIIGGIAAIATSFALRSQENKSSAV
ncbi:MAG TPA: DUF308 domain-containing protein [Methanoregulaceae archaeon]|nr:DUF308 domain-containing protein [Methanoregulaceae archaeon]